MNKLDNYLYVGSCRYQGLFKHFFPPRLHSTKEFIYFLNNFENLDFDSPMQCFIYGDCRHNLCYDKAIEFRKNFTSKHDLADSGIDTVIFEICTNKVYMRGDVPFNDFYTRNAYLREDLFDKIVMTKEDLIEDLKIISDILITKFNISKIAIITHIDLPLENGELIPSRHALVENLEDISQDLNIPIYSLGKIFEADFNGISIKDVLPDDFHYQNGININDKDNESGIVNIYFRSLYRELIKNS